MRKFNGSLIPLPDNFDDFIKKIDLKKPLSIEIGCGSGDNIYNLAKLNPNKFFIAFERTNNKYTKKPNLDNFLFLNREAEPFIYHLCCNYNIKLEKIYVLYPNPEPKRINQRWPNKPFLFFLINYSEVKIIFRSNLFSYIKELQTNLNKKNIDNKIKTIYKPDLTITNFEKKYTNKNQTCYELIYN